VPAITTFIDDRVKALVGDDAAQRASARDAILAQVPGNGPTPIYYRTFANALDAAVTEALKTATPVGKLNLAITVARVAERANNTSLAGVTRQLLKDPSDSVVLWGVKASQPIVPVLAASPLDPNVDLIKEVRLAAETHGAAWIIDEAYVALALAKSTSITKPMIAAVMPDLSALLQHRVTLYAGGVPPLPAADNRATAFFVQGSVWTNLTDPKRLAAVQLMTDLLNAATAQFGFQAQQGRGELMPLIKQAGKAFWVVAENVGNANMRKAAEAVSALNQGSQPAAVTQATAALATATAAVPAFKTLRVALPAAPQPTTAAAAVAVP
jgi:hypothetical protein